MKRNIQIGLTIIILTISSYLFISNIGHIIYLRTTSYSYNFKNGPEIESIKRSLDNIKENIKKMDKLTNSHLTEEELNGIKEDLIDKVEQIDSLDFLKAPEKENKMSQVEVFKMVNGNFTVGIISTIEQCRTLSNHKENVGLDDFIENVYLLLMSSGEYVKPLMNNYQYPNKFIKSDNDNYMINAIMNNLSMRINVIEYISNLVVESGDINE
ncbi:MAG: hypothetical protein PHI05_01235 [Bacilli bacterium]|nr:hypothetical protein [Bacilli bacterium]MDD4547351.1 hypothetical protein [Bacilli bacterium]